MRTQIARVIDLDDESWRMPRVDPTGWLARRPVDGRDAAGDPGELPAEGPADRSVDHVHRRRPRRTQAARIARERDLARRRRRRQGLASGVGPAAGWSPGATSPRRVVEPVEREGYRIGRWARLSLTVLALAALALFAARLIAGLSAGAVEPVDVTVRPGDTLWSIATEARWV